MTDRDAQREVHRWRGRFRFGQSGQLISRSEAQRLARAARQSDALQIEIVYPLDADGELIVVVRAHSEGVMAPTKFRVAQGDGGEGTAFPYLT